MENNGDDFLSRIEAFTATTTKVKKYDKLITQASESAERRPEFYSNKINSLRICTSIAHGQFHQLRKYQQFNIQAFQSRLQRASATIEFKDNPKEVYQGYKDLRGELQEATKHSQDIRKHELASRIHKKHTKGSPEYIQRLKNIKKGEGTRRAWQTMKFLTSQSGATQTLNRIDIPHSWPPPNLNQEEKLPICQRYIKNNYKAQRHSRNHCQ
jgi:hypothetical protein